MTPHDPRTELGELRAALAAHLARRRRASPARQDRTPERPPLGAAQPPHATPAARPAPPAQPAAPAPPPAAQSAPAAQSPSATHAARPARIADAIPAPPSAPPSTSPREAPAPAPAPPAPPSPRRAADPSPAAPAWDAPFPSDWGTTPERKDELERRVVALRARAATAPDLAALRAAVSTCNACGLCATRKQTVFLDGAAPARVLFVGEAPGFQEDQQGVPFVGPAGQLLTDIVTKGMGLQRSQVAIANVLKCRPPDNRDPTPTEKRLCTPWLDRQIDLLDPPVLIALGRHAACHLLDTDAPIGRLRGRVWERAGRKVIATYHPAFLLRSPHMKKDCWQDVQLAMRELGLPLPGKR